MEKRMLLLTLLVLLLLGSIDAQISKPIAHDSNVEESVKQNKFRSREASDDLLGYPNLDEEALANTQCPRNLELRWQAEASASIYAAPLIADINGDGKLDIVVPSFVHYLDVLEGADGEKMQGWPAYHQSTVHSSPLLYDIDKDGYKEILLPTYNGEVLMFRSSGYPINEKITVPRLRVRKDWYVGLSPDHVDRSHPDVHDDGLVIPSPPGVSSDHAVANASSTIATKDGQNGSSTIETKDGQNGSSPGNVSGKLDNSTLSNTPETLNVSATATAGNGSATLKVSDVAEAGSELRMGTTSPNNTQGTQRRLLQQEATAGDNREKLEADAEATFDVFRDKGGLSDEYAYDYDDYVDESMWTDDHWVQAVHEREEDFIDIDAHILCTPVIADIDKDGVDELIVAASFFFDREYYEANPDLLSKDVDISKYVAGAIFVFSLDTKQVKWKIHFDLSTDSVAFRAYIYSSPTVVDLDGDGYLSIVVGTSFGFVYALHYNGIVRKNFPLQMGEIHAQVVAADVNDDGKVEIVTADTRGNVVAWETDGKLLWEVHLKSMIAQAPTVGDVNGDGITDVVVPTASGNIYVLKGTDGSYVPPFPFRTHGRIMASVLLLDFGNKESEQADVVLVATSFDGYLYIIDGKTGCADATDIGETSYTMVLVENVDGGDDLDLIVTTMNGNVYCFQTPVKHHPLKAWPTANQGRNVLSPRYNREGVYALPSSRKFRDEAGESFWVVFKIVDQHNLHGPYNVTLTLLVPGNYHEPRRITQWHRYDQPGVQKLKVPCVPIRSTGTVTLEMVDRHGLAFTDEFSLTFHMHYYRLLKWFVVLPLLGMLVAIVGLHPEDHVSLPSFSSNGRHQM
ncbi:protein DEFECTIVE IN EXINE FORMATION 1 [Selaginella moellendorffii]|uniref:protein DEFECTIVE IN EXINE FORMATION 1 n=1 Tax=Selaginella moellendorffii TaxID=88036 RepID=UPI000D1C6943|nr:protein DEFECTIVE IN EXINE FORMATION 1 [Selaginella moellendorffii]|eukprot:XP_024536256.1 protein DEFECTIVE IN EXINE FORMATION 1 [Selaginella moellendorffii]